MTHVQRFNRIARLCDAACHLLGYDSPAIEALLHAAVAAAQAGAHEAEKDLESEQCNFEEIRHLG